MTVSAARPDVNQLLERLLLEREIEGERRSPPTWGDLVISRVSTFRSRGVDYGTGRS